MPSPFPGMDPYIEHPEVWSDFHGDLAAEIRAELNKVIQPRYVARLTPRVTYEIVEIDDSSQYPPGRRCLAAAPRAGGGGWRSGRHLRCAGREPGCDGNAPAPVYRRGP